MDRAPTCSDPNDASGSELSGKTFATDDSIDVATTVHGVINGATDVDWYRGTVTDTSFSLLQPNIQNVTTGTELCAFVKCAGATTVSCSAGSAATSESGEQGCCVTGPGALKPSWNCTGTLNDSATVSFRVKSSNACLPYSFSYVF